MVQVTSADEGRRAASGRGGVRKTENGLKASSTSRVATRLELANIREEPGRAASHVFQISADC
jgi:hypothetical protein